MNQRITVHNQAKEAIYDIAFSNGFASLAKEFSALGYPQTTKICIVTDSNVAPHYLQAAKDALENVCNRVESFTFQAGEPNKTLDTVADLYEHLIQQKFDRKDVLLALGGGVVGDLTGYAAATYLRGIDFIQVPTTLLSCVDSSIGGKTGVDFRGYKNMVGAFYMPRLVYMNFETFRTLPQREIACGMAEVIKYGYIQDASFLTWLTEKADALSAGDLDAYAQLVYTCCQCKREVVEEDPTEKGRRAILNFGHTIGHAIEKLMNFSLLHGECVALGMVGAGTICVTRGLISVKDLEKMRALLTTYRLPIALTDAPFSPEKVLEIMQSDKKVQAGKIKFILLNGVGEGIIDSTLNKGELIDGIASILH